MEYRDGEYFLNTEESSFLFRQAAHPDEAVMERRNRFFAELDELHVTYTADGGMTIDVPMPVFPRVATVST